MNRVKSVLVGLSLMVAGALIAYPVYAHCGQCAADGKKIASMLEQNKLTLAKSVEAAEKHSKGRAISLISELNSGKLQQEVYCIVGDKIMKCEIDGKTATVTAMKESSTFPITEAESEHGHSHDDHDHGQPQGSAQVITNQLVEVACGSCVYKMQGVKGCEIAVKIDGKQYPVTGANVDAHQFCSGAKRALVSGKIENNKFVATKFQVQT